MEVNQSGFPFTKSIDSRDTKLMKANLAILDDVIDWVGDIPDHWRKVQLKFAAPRVTEKSLSHKASDIQITLENIESHSGRLLGYGNFDGVGNVFKKGDVLYNKLRPYLK